MGRAKGARGEGDRHVAPGAAFGYWLSMNGLPRAREHIQLVVPQPPEDTNRNSQCLSRLSIKTLDPGNFSLLKDELRRSNAQRTDNGLDYISGIKGTLRSIHRTQVSHKISTRRKFGEIMRLAIQFSTKYTSHRTTKFLARHGDNQSLSVNHISFAGLNQNYVQP